MALPRELEATVDRAAEKVTIPKQEQYEDYSGRREQLLEQRGQAERDLAQAQAELDVLTKQIEAEFGPNLPQQMGDLAADQKQLETDDINKGLKTIDIQAPAIKAVVDRMNAALAHTGSLSNMKALEGLMNAAFAAIDPGDDPQRRNNVRHQWDQAKTTLINKLREQWGRAAESVGANNVTDGFELYQRYKKGKPDTWDGTTIPWKQPGTATPGGLFDFGLPELNSADYQAVCRQLDLLGDVIDALSDTVVAESMYHLVKGNPVRAGATLDAVAKGEAPPPELEISATPTSGIGVSHRIVSFLSSTASLPPGWPSGGDQIRARIEPYLNAWTAQFLPNPQKVMCRINVRSRDTRQVVDTVAVALDALNLGPLDCLTFSESTGQAARSELEQRLAYYRRYMHTPPPADTTDIDIDFDRDRAWPSDTVSVGEWLQVLSMVRRLVTSVRPLDSRDLALPQEAGVADTGIDVEDLQQRADGAVSGLKARLTTLRTSMEALRSGADPSGTRGELLGLAAFGIPGCIPDSFTHLSDANASLLSQGEDVAKKVQGRVDRLNDLAASISPNADVGVQIKYHLDRLKQVFGEAFLVIPRFRAQNSAVLAHAFADHTRLLGDDDVAAPLTWFEMISRVRGGAARFKAACNYAEAIGGPATLTLQVAQLPYQETDRWIALPAASDRPIEAGRLSIVACLSRDVDVTQFLTGLLIDEWVEIIPYARQVTGITFHYDQPNARAPQSIVLAVAPDIQPEGQPASWDLSTLSDVLVETVELAKIRALAPDQGVEIAWLGDAVRQDGIYGGDEKWQWGTEDNAPYSGRVTHLTAALPGLHQHYFYNAAERLVVNKGDSLYAYVFVDPVSPPSAVMLQWLCDGETEWKHRAYWGPYWGADNPAWGAEKTASRFQRDDRLPSPGQWIRLEVPASAVALEGKSINGIAFTVYDGKAKWGHAGKIMRPCLVFPESLKIDLSRAARPTGVDHAPH